MQVSRVPANHVYGQLAVECSQLHQPRNTLVASGLLLLLIFLLLNIIIITISSACVRAGVIPGLITISRVSPSAKRGFTRQYQRRGVQSANNDKESGPRRGDALLTPSFPALEFLVKGNAKSEYQQKKIYKRIDSFRKIHADALRLPRKKRSFVLV